MAIQEDGWMVKLTVKRDAKGNISLDGADFIPTWVYMDQNPDNEYFILPLDESGESGKEYRTYESDR